MTTMQDKETIERLTLALQEMTKERDDYLFLYERTKTELEETVFQDDALIAELREEVRELHTTLRDTRRDARERYARLMEVVEVTRND